METVGNRVVFFASVFARESFASQEVGVLKMLMSETTTLCEHWSFACEVGRRRHAEEFAELAQRMGFTRGAAMNLQNGLDMELTDHDDDNERLQRLEGPCLSS